jgi:hypothetical protein
MTRRHLPEDGQLPSVWWVTHRLVIDVAFRRGHSVQTGSVTCPMGTRDPHPYNTPEALRLHQSNAGFKNAWSSPSIFPVIFTAWWWRLSTSNVVPFAALKIMYVCCCLGGLGNCEVLQLAAVFKWASRFSSLHTCFVHEQLQLLTSSLWPNGDFMTEERNYVRSENWTKCTNARWGKYGAADSGFGPRGKFLFYGVKKLNGKRLTQDGRWPQVPSARRVTT